MTSSAVSTASIFCDARSEAQILTRYLLSRQCPDALAERYEAGVARFFGGQSRDPVLAFALVHPSSLPFLDAAAAVVRGGEALRDRLHLMTAVLEASPEFVDEFLPPATSATATIIGLAIDGLAAMAKIAVGVPLLLALRNPAR